MSERKTSEQIDSALIDAGGWSESATRAKGELKKIIMDAYREADESVYLRVALGEQTARLVHLEVQLAEAEGRLSAMKSSPSEERLLWGVSLGDPVKNGNAFRTFPNRADAVLHLNAMGIEGESIWFTSPNGWTELNR